MTVAAESARGTRRALAAASVALAAVLLDATAVPVLLPSVRLDLGSSSSGVQWAQNAYLLALAAPLPSLARLALVAGGRAMAACGALAMAAGAVVCASADSTAVLVAGRAVEGAAAAAVLASLAALPWQAGGTAAHAGLAATRPALAAVLPALALGLGPLVGGAFSQADWWRVFFWVAAPLAVVAGAAPLLVPSTPRQRPTRDLPGLLALGALLTGLTIALVQSEPWGWGWLGLAGLVAAAIVLPLVPPLRRHLTSAAAVWFALAGCLASLGFLLPQYFELARGLSPLRIGALLLAVTLPAVVGWAIGWWPAARLGARVVVLAGLACAAIGLAALAPIDTGSAYARLLPALALAGAGLGLAGGALRGVPAPQGSALAAALTGAALGLAAAGAVFQQAQADDRAATASFEHALASGVGTAVLLLLVLVVAAVPAAWRLRRSES